MYADDWAAWHEAHERRRARPHGLLAATGLHWLTPEWQRFDDVPGEWRDAPDGVSMRTEDGETNLGQVGEDGVELMFGDVMAEVARRGTEVILRPRDPRNPVRLAYKGTPAFPPDEKWIVTGRFVEDRQEITIDTVVDGLKLADAALGRVDFTLEGTELSLTVFDGFEIIFRDATSGVTTYGASRTLTIDPPADDGTVVLDFNRATNLPCAYTEFATCSLPPPENVLPVAVEAGEKSP
ncbi:DUF1684 domain-containing protein [Actinoplanes sp. NPDC051411]|jgi:uncharacterized protein (DUF1684 family)|uniref:DUF1684 domain-containing protein n=1 Tax=Actinoplanes sp. NPDC051411 TaxID=3155522 RepID=UPI003419E3BA